MIDYDLYDDDDCDGEGWPLQSPRCLLQLQKPSVKTLGNPGVVPGALLQLGAVAGRADAVEAPGLLRGARRGAHHVLRQLLEVSVLQPHGGDHATR